MSDDDPQTEALRELAAIERQETQRWARLERSATLRGAMIALALIAFMLAVLDGAGAFR